MLYITLHKLYNTLHNCTKLYKIVQNFTILYSTLQHFTTLYKTLQNVTKRYKTAQLYKGLHNFTSLYIILCSFTKLCKQQNKRYKTLPHFTKPYKSPGFYNTIHNYTKHKAWKQQVYSIVHNSTHLYTMIETLHVQHYPKLLQKKTKNNKNVHNLTRLDATLHNSKYYTKPYKCTQHITQLVQRHR